MLAIVLGGLMGGVAAFAFAPSTSLSSLEMASLSDQKNTDTELSTDTPQSEGESNRQNTLNTDASQQAAIAQLPKDTTKTVSVGKGDTLMKVLTRAGADPRESHKAITALSEVFDPRRLKVGQDIILNFEQSAEAAEAANADINLVSISLKQDVDKQVAAIRTPNNDFQVRETVISLEKKMVRSGGVIQNSLFLSAAQAGLPTKVILEMIRIFSYDVDFQREIQPGDQFEVYFERFVDENGTPLKEGRIQWASMTLSGTEIALYRYTTKDDGFTDYYTSEGQSVRKTLMRTPIDGARLTSRFGKRRHPVLGYTKMHRGVDFGASRGTPIMAAGNGTVEMAQRNGSFGNYVRIRHNSGYKTAYAHMKGFAKGIRKGKRVKQGQVIGYVGTTGRSTGPHLHYEVHKNGRQINPLSVKLPAGRKLKGGIMADFKRFTGKMDKAIAALPLNKQVASLD
ncbi:M23 family metallopeptidase [Sneathiella sp.]|uniref:M23 family metallopeptidase n=1 Tax=Sneathiella sp. TaxID=1964365 RepID=UPI0039E5492C